jgi:hypothetical protein
MKRCSLSVNKEEEGTGFRRVYDALQYVEDGEIYPEITKDITFKIAPDSLDSNSIYVKRLGVNNYETMQ